METKNWSVHAEFVVIFVTLLGGFFLLDNKIDRVTEAQSARSDRLYEMFIDLLKEKNK
jgi:hypothetical protein